VTCVQFSKEDDIFDSFEVKTVLAVRDVFKFDRNDLERLLIMKPCERSAASDVPDDDQPCKGYSPRMNMALLLRYSFAIGSLV